jgi:hypothetical protein
VTLNFTTALEKINSVFLVRLPPNVSNQLQSRQLTMAEVFVNQIEFKTVLEPDGVKGHWIEISDKIFSKLNVKQGEVVTVKIEVIKDWIEPEVPADLNLALDSDYEARQTWSLLTTMSRWQWIRWIRSTHNPETRQKRILVAVSKLKKGDHRPCCFNSATCTVPEVSKNSEYGWVLREE